MQWIVHFPDICPDKHTHTIDIVAISKLYVNFTAHRSEHGVLSHCYPASELERYDGPLACCVEGWKEELKVSLRAAAKLQAPWNKFTANSCRCTTGCSTKKCRCLRNGLCCSSHCHGGKCCTNQKHDEPNEKEDEPHRTRKREMESAKLRTPNEVSLSCLGLHDSDVKILEGQRWLNHRIVNAAQNFSDCSILTSLVCVIVKCLYIVCIQFGPGCFCVFCMSDNCSLH